MPVPILRYPNAEHIVFTVTPRVVGEGQLSSWYYRRCLAGDEAAIHRALRLGNAVDPEYSDVIAATSSQIVADDDDDYFDGAFTGRRVLIKAAPLYPFLGVVFLDFDQTARQVTVNAYPPGTENGAADFTPVYADIWRYLYNVRGQSANFPTFRIRIHEPGQIPEWIQTIAPGEGNEFSNFNDYSYLTQPVAPAASAVAGDASIVVSWPAKAGYSHDVDYRKESDKDWTHAVNLKGTTHTIPGLTNGDRYLVRVRSRKGRVLERSRWWKSEAVVPVRPPAPLLAAPTPTVTVDGLTAAIMWGAVTGAKMYRVFINGVVVGTTDETSYEYTGSAGTHTVALDTVNADDKPGARGDAVSFTLAE